MFISNNINHYNSYINNNKSALRQNVLSNHVLSMDTVTFTGSNETRLKNISGLHDPYSDIVMVTDDEYSRYLKKLDKRPNALTVLNLLSSYDKNMFPPEQEVCETLTDMISDKRRENLRLANKVDLHDLLNELYVGSKVSLARNQLSILGEIDELVSGFKGNSKKVFTEIFEPVKNSIKDDSFRMSPLLAEVYSRKDVNFADKQKVLELMKKFPNSRNSADVFIINNAEKSHREIAEAFISPSRVSIEHIRPQSAGGESSITNYLIASRRMNNLRSSMPLDKFVMEHPNIPMQTERYMSDLVKRINKGGLTYMAMSLPKITETLRAESKGAIDIEVLDISSKENKRAGKLEDQLSELVRKFCK